MSLNTFPGEHVPRRSVVTCGCRAGNGHEASLVLLAPVPAYRPAARRRYMQTWCMRGLLSANSKGLAAAEPGSLAVSAFRPGGARSVRTSAKHGRLPPGPADVLIVDGTNLAFSAAADRNRWAHLGATLAGCFGDYLAFLATATGRPAERYVVFDRAKADNVPLRRQQEHPDYLRTRTSKLRARKAPKPADWATRLASTLRWLLWGSEAGRRRLWAAARKAGYTPLEAQNGWEADDAIAALCRLIREGEGRHRPRVAVVSNDTDLHQLLDERTRVLAVRAWHDEAGGRGPLETMTAAGFQAMHGFPPPVFPYQRALAGKKHSNVAGLGLPQPTIRRACQFLSLALSQGSTLDGSLPPGFESVLGPGAQAALGRLRSNLRLTLLHSGADALPAGFARQSARIPAAAAARESAAASVSGEQVPTGAAQNKEALSAATLAWLSPFNAARAKYLRPHVEALSACLHRAGVKHRLWAVSRDGLPIDIAILAEPAKLVRYGFTTHSVILILGPGDLRSHTATPPPPKPALHAPRSGERRILEDLRVPPPEQPQLSQPAAARLKALRRAGWHVHVVNHARLQALLHYAVPAKPLQP